MDELELYKCSKCGRRKNVAIPSQRPLFTEAEHRIVCLVAQRKINKEIADTLFIRENSVKFHLTTIYRKLNIVTRYELQRLCDEHPKVMQLGLKAKDWRNGV